MPSPSVMVDDGYRGRIANMRLLIGTPFYRGADVPYLISMIATGHALDVIGVDWDYLPIIGDTYVDRAKNSICACFIDDPKQYTDLFIIDSDMGWDIEGFMRVLFADEEFTCGIYPMKTDKMIYPYAPVDGRIVNGKVRADWVPGGFMRMKRSVIEKLNEASADNWYIDETAFYKKKTYNLFEFILHDNRRYGDDVVFCKKWRNIGGEIWIVPSVKFTHTGIHSWYGNMENDILSKEHHDST